MPPVRCLAILCCQSFPPSLLPLMSLISSTVCTRASFPFAFCKSVFSLCLHTILRGFLSFGGKLQYCTCWRQRVFFFEVSWKHSGKMRRIFRQACRKPRRGMDDGRTIPVCNLDTCLFMAHAVAHNDGSNYEPGLPS